MPNGLTDFIKSVGDFVSGAVETVKESVTDTIEKAKPVLSGVVNTVKSTVSSAATTATNIYNNIVSGTKSTLEDVIDTTKAVISGVTGGAKTQVNNAANKAKEVVDEVEEASKKGFDDTVTKVSDETNKLIDDLLAWLKGQTGKTAEEAKSTLDSIINAIKGGLGDTEDLIAALLSSLPTIDFSMILSLIPSIGDIASAITGSGKAQTETLTSISDKVEQSNPLKVLITLFKLTGEALANVKKLGDTEEGSVETAAKAEFIKLLALTGMLVGSPMGFLPAIGDVYSAGLGEIIRHDSMQVHLPTLLPPTVAVEARHRELIDDNRFTHDLIRQGFATSRAKTLFELYYKILDIDTLRLLYLRGEIDDSRLMTEMTKQGYRYDDVEDIKKLFYFIPGVQDLIRMAVREAFTPEIAEKFGQYQDFPPALAEWGKKQGLSEEWSKAYWAAHWDLPSPQMGYEMLHRGIITEDELKMLLRALDVMPFWRDKLIQISYSPFTRVDVRRMHKLGIISDDELIRAYKDIGYNDVKAKQMADFTILYNADPEDTELTEADKRKAKDRDLTKGDLLKAYHDRLLPQDEIKQALMDMGYAEDESTYYIMREDFLVEQDTVNSYLGIYKQAYLKGVIDYNTLIDLLGQLNLPAEQSKQLVDVWTIERSLRVSKPTKSELLGWWKRGLLKDDQLIDELHGLGYDDKYIKLYMATKTAEEE